MVEQNLFGSLSHGGGCTTLHSTRRTVQVRLTVGVDGAVALGIAGHRGRERFGFLLKFGKHPPRDPQQLAPERAVIVHFVPQ